MPAKLYDGLQLTIKTLDILYNHYMLKSVPIRCNSTVILHIC